MKLLKWLDIPPVWLAGFAAIVWLLPGAGSLFDRQLFDTFGVVFIAAGLGLMIWAVLQMLRRRTTPIPRMQPSALVSDGVFGLSRNPIYLGDALILTGIVLWSGAPWMLLLVPAFCLIINARFIRAEEARLQAAFPGAFDDYTRRTRRWI